MEEIDLREVAQKYNSIPEIWDAKDKWHSKTRNAIKDFVWYSFGKIHNVQNLKILNAGSAGYSYELPEKHIVHIDVAKNKMSHLSNAIVANIQNMPIRNNQFGLIICVGSVLNYCDPLKTIEEFSRVLDKYGYIILEFENSRTLELLGTSDFNKKVALRDTFYFKKKERLWYFSEQFIQEVFDLNQIEIIRVDRCHIISPLIYRFTKNEDFSALFGSLDSFFKYIPVINKLSSNTIFLARKV